LVAKKFEFFSKGAEYSLEGRKWISWLSGGQNLWTQLKPSFNVDRKLDEIELR